MVINAMRFGGGYNIETETQAQGSNMVMVTLPSKPKSIILIPRSVDPFVAVGRISYAVWDDTRQAYVGASQGGTSGGYVSWTDKSSGFAWDEQLKRMTCYVRCGSGDTITYHAVG